jgi:hypothetical protein
MSFFSSFSSDYKSASNSAVFDTHIAYVKKNAVSHLQALKVIAGEIAEKYETFFLYKMSN